MVDYINHHQSTIINQTSLINHGRKPEDVRIQGMTGRCEAAGLKGNCCPNEEHAAWHGKEWRIMACLGGSLGRVGWSVSWVSGCLGGWVGGWKDE